VIDRSKTRDIPLHPSAVKGRSNDWNLCRGNHLGQRSCASATISRTYGRKRSDQGTAQQLARSGPSTYGLRRGKARSNGHGCHVGRSPPTPSVSSFMRWLTISAISCARWRRPSRSRISSSLRASAEKASTRQNCAARLAFQPSNQNDRLSVRSWCYIKAEWRCSAQSLR
jgi:hypothetical protein